MSKLEFNSIFKTQIEIISIYLFYTIFTIGQSFPQCHQKYTSQKPNEKPPMPNEKLIKELPTKKPMEFQYVQSFPSNFFF